jgi:GR25 family glycosyltransferase involved in LPS biosynthesis
MSFDAIIYINLEHRKDRNKLILEEIDKLNINLPIHRIDAILTPLCGFIGCAKSHILAIELAIKYNYSAVLILEDDTYFDMNTYKKDIFTKIKDINWDVMLLGKGYSITQPTQYDYLYIAKKTTCAHAYIIRKHYYDTLINNIKESIKLMENQFTEYAVKFLSENKTVPKLFNSMYAHDQYWFILQEKDIFYLINPIMAFQRNIPSDIMCDINWQTHNYF